MPTNPEIDRAREILEVELEDLQLKEIAVKKAERCVQQARKKLDELEGRK